MIIDNGQLATKDVMPRRDVEYPFSVVAGFSHLLPKVPSVVAVIAIRRL